MLITKKDYKLAIEYLNDEEVIALPTETVMGLAIKASSLEAYNRLIEIKNRPLNKAFPFIVGSLKDIEKYAYVDEITKKIIEAFMPGPLTIILKKYLLKFLKEQELWCWKMKTIHFLVV